MTAPDSAPIQITTRPPVPLDEYGDEDIAGAEAGVVLPETFKISDEETAMWAARKLRSILDEIGERERLAQNEIRRIEEWCNDANRPLDNARLFFESHLESYHRGLRMIDDKRKSIKLPGVTLKSRASQGAWEFDDETFIAWAESAAPELLNVKTTVAVAAAKQALTVHDTDTGRIVTTAAGELVPGVTVGDESVSFSVAVETAKIAP